MAQALAHWDEARAAYRNGLAVAEMLTKALLPQDDDYRNLRASFARSLAELETAAQGGPADDANGTQPRSE